MPPKKPKESSKSDKLLDSLSDIELENASVTSVSENESESGSSTEEPIIRICDPQQTIQGFEMGDSTTEIKMTPIWFQQESEMDAISDISYPSGITDKDKRPFNAVARYRKITDRKDFFRRKTVQIKPNTVDILITALNEFAEEYGGDLCFTKQELSHDDNVNRAACGIATISSIHLIATNYIPTAQFSFHTELSYEDDLAKSPGTMKNFVLSFATSIAEVLGLSGNEFIRVTSVSKDEDDCGKAKISFGLTLPDKEETIKYAKELEDYAGSGFRKHPSLRAIRSNRYECKWKPLITYLQLNRNDFDEKHNFDYNRQGLQHVGMRGNYPYYVPVGWYRYALNTSNIYGNEENDRWLGCENIPGEWPIAYYGTHGNITGDSETGDLSIKKEEADPLREEAVEQIGRKADVPGIYLSTRCNGGAHPWQTKTFEVKMTEKKVSRFRIVFQCRVRPTQFTIHKRPDKKREIWRVVDPDVIRLYGILVRKMKLKKHPDDESESDG
ncbi:hypothetical protein I4U23_030029 [Adineta vaga]|nr:hypothetical protein I4U23_030029 [Adineta vaga]